MKILQNQEHLEAAQFEADKIRNECLKTMDETIQNRFKIISEVLEILSKNNIPCYLFPLLPHGKQSKKLTVWQYNNLESFSKFDLAGKTTKETIELWKIINEGLNTILYEGIYKKSMNSPDLNSYFNFIVTCLKNHYDYLFGDENKEGE